MRYLRFGFFVVLVLAVASCGADATDDSTSDAIADTGFEADVGDNADAGPAADTGIDASTASDASNADASTDMAEPDMAVPEEVCNGLDDNGNGVVDDGLGADCTCSQREESICTEDPACASLDAIQAEAWWIQNSFCATSVDETRHNQVVGSSRYTDCLGVSASIQTSLEYTAHIRFDAVTAAVASDEATVQISLTRGISPDGSYVTVNCPTSSSNCPTGGCSRLPSAGTLSATDTIEIRLDLENGVVVDSLAGLVATLSVPATAERWPVVRTTLDSETVRAVEERLEELLTMEARDVLSPDHAGCVAAGPCLTNTGPVWGRPIGGDTCLLMGYACLPTDWEPCTPTLDETCAPPPAP